jgi:hypothetical protein
MNASEKRLATRVRVRLRVDCKPLDHAEQSEVLEGHGFHELSYRSLALTRPRTGMTPMRACDISLSGLRLEGALPLGLGDSAVLDLHLPDERVAVKALVDVVWSQPAQDRERPHSCGLRFAAMDDEGVRRLRSFLVQAPAMAC